jgi:hypothetical protein
MAFWNSTKAKPLFSLLIACFLQLLLQGDYTSLELLWPPSITDASQTHSMLLLALLPFYSSATNQLTTQFALDLVMLKIPKDML